MAGEEEEGEECKRELVFPFFGFFGGLACNSGLQVIWFN